MTAEPAWTGVLESPPGAEVRIDGREYLYFAGTAYLALQGRPEVIAAGCDALQRYGVQTATSRGGFGTSPPLLEVERLAAEFFGTEAAFYYITGYWGAALTLGGLTSEFDVAFYDEQSHYSVLESLRLRGRPMIAFRHRDANDLAAKLKANGGRMPLVASDGVFALSGRIAPVDEYFDVLQSYPASSLYLDDAHAVGVLGNGRGTFAEFGWSFAAINIDERLARQPRLFTSATCSKALGGSGGIIAGSAVWIARVKKSSYYANAAGSPPAPVAGATAAALRLIQSEPALLQRLQSNTKQLRAGLRGLGLEVEDSPVPFLTLSLGNADRMQHIQRTLRERGLIIGYFPTYSGADTGGNLRIAISAGHTEAMIRRLIDALAPLL